MMGGWTDDRLERALQALGDDLVVPTPSGPRRRSRSRRLLLAAAAVLVVGAAVAAWPTTRRAVADWLGLRSVEFRIVDEASSGAVLDRFADGVPAVGVDEALAATDLDARALVESGLGRPDAAGRPPEGGVLLVWADGTTTLWVRSVGQGMDADELVVKQMSVDDEARRIDDLGEGAVYVDGDHVLATPSRRVAADRILWWVDDDVEYRLESDRPGAVLLAIGRELTP